MLGLHRTAEALKHAFAMRAALGDPGPPAAPFLDLSRPLADMLNSSYVDALRAATRDDGVLPLGAYGGRRYSVLRSGAPPEDHGTSHLSVVDEGRMAVAMTTTINTGFGRHAREGGGGGGGGGAMGAETAAAAGAGVLAAAQSACAPQPPLPADPQQGAQRVHWLTAQQPDGAGWGRDGAVGGLGGWGGGARARASSCRGSLPRGPR